MAGLRSLFATSVAMLNTSVETLSTVVDCVSNGSQALANASDEYIKLQVAKHEALRTVRISETAREIAQAQIKEQDKMLVLSRNMIQMDLLILLIKWKL